MNDKDNFCEPATGYSEAEKDALLKAFPSRSDEKVQTPEDDLKNPDMMRLIIAIIVITVLGVMGIGYLFVCDKL